MTVMSFFCRLINGWCMQEPRKSERYPKTQTTAASSAPYPSPPLPRVMKIGIIGAGQIGGTLTRRLTALGHKVFVANSRGPQTLLDLASETGATPVSVPDAVRGMDLVIVTIPEKNIPRLPAGLFADTPNRVVVVDTGNYYPRQRDGRIEPIEGGLPESKWVAKQLGHPVPRRSTTYMPDTSWNWAGLRARLAASLCLLQATMRQPRPSSSTWSINWALMASMRADWMSPGGNSPARQSTLRTSMPKVCGAHYLRPRKNGPQIGAAPQRAPAASPPPLEALHVGLFTKIA